jgi:hypothetical protein
MQPSRQKRRWHAEWQSRPGSSTDHRETQRRLHGSSFRHDNQDDDPWPPRSTSQLQQRREGNSAATPPWRDTVQQRESRAQDGARWIPSETDEHSQRRQQPVRRWRSPDPPLRWYRSELERSSDSRSSAQRRQDPHPLRAPRPHPVSRLGGGHARDPVVHEQWNSEFAQDTRSNQRKWVPNVCHDDVDDYDDDEYNDDDDDDNNAADYDDDDNDDDDDDDDEEEEDDDEHNNFTLKHRHSPPSRSYERWQNVRADHRLQRTEGPIRLSHDDHVDALPNRVPCWPAQSQPSRRVEMPARRSSQSDKCSQDSPSEAYQGRATQSLTTNSVDVQSSPIRPRRQEALITGKSVSSIVRRPHHTFEAGEEPSLVNKHDEAFDNSEDNMPEINGHSASKRRPSARGKRKATLKHDMAVVDCDSQPGEKLVAIKQIISACASANAKPSSHGSRTRRRKQCQYPEGCDKGAIGRTLFCIAHGGGKRCQFLDGCGNSALGSTMFCIGHGGGKRCQYPDGCDKGAIGRTLFCKAHGGGKRCQYPDGCGNSALGSTMFCRSHGGGKRCQYPEGCDKGAQGSTIFCKAHGGGKRCQYPDGCDSSARGSTMFCRAHGGGKRCQYPEGCGKSAIGRTLFCKAHGGGKRCQYPEGCDKSAQGSTMFCVAHGGGKRCQYPEGCNSGSRGSTLLCKAHGGGKRCEHVSGCHKHVIRGGLCKSHGAEAGV